MKSPKLILRKISLLAIKSTTSYKVSNSAIAISTLIFKPFASLLRYQTELALCVSVVETTSLVMDACIYNEAHLVIEFTKLFLEAFK